VFLPARAAFKDVPDQPADFGIDHRLATADADDRRAAFIDRIETFLDAQLLLDALGVFTNPSAARARQVAGVKRLEHENQGEALLPGDFFLDDVCRH